MESLTVVPHSPQCALESPARMICPGQEAGTDRAGELERSPKLIPIPLPLYLPSHWSERHHVLILVSSKTTGLAASVHGCVFMSGFWSQGNLASYSMANAAGNML